MRRRLEEFMQGRYGADEVFKIYHGSDAGTADPEYVHENPASLSACAGIPWLWLFQDVFQKYFKEKQ